jgi:SAM-dependent methyltransferase
MDTQTLEKMLERVGDLGLRRRIVTLLGYLDIRDGETILDCGCGEGFYSMAISELYDADVTAFDWDAALLKMASGWIRKKDRITFVSGDIERGLPFKDGSFDKIIFSEVLEHLDDDRHAIREVYRVLKKGGTVGLTVPNSNYPLLWDPLNWLRESLGLGHFDAMNTVLGGVWSYGHKRLYAHSMIKELVEEVGFKVSKIEVLTRHCFPCNYHILRLGKILSTKLPAGSTLKRSTEKFEWRDGASGGGMPFPMSSIFDAFRRIDSKNNRALGLDEPSVSIALRLVR